MGLVELSEIPQGLTRWGSMTLATPGRSDTKLVCSTFPDNRHRSSRASKLGLMRLSNVELRLARNMVVFLLKLVGKLGENVLFMKLARVSQISAVYLSSISCQNAKR